MRSLCAQVLESSVSLAEEAGVANGDAKSTGVGTVDRQKLFYCERFVEFMIDLMSQAPTRRYTHAIFEDRAVLIKCKMVPLFQHEKGRPSTETADIAILPQILECCILGCSKQDFCMISLQSTQHSRMATAE